jgi:hypothetical protein
MFLYIVVMSQQRRGLLTGYARLRLLRIVKLVISFFVFIFEITIIHVMESDCQCVLVYFLMCELNTQKTTNVVPKI